jgi:hypothetical protein
MAEDIADCSTTCPGRGFVVLEARSESSGGRSNMRLPPGGIDSGNARKWSFRLLNGMSPDDRQRSDVSRRMRSSVADMLGPEEQRIARSLMSYGSGRSAA